MGAINLLQKNSLTVCQTPDFHILWQPFCHNAGAQAKRAIITTLPNFQAFIRLLSAKLSIKR
jgi:hypothetical protein